MESESNTPKSLIQVFTSPTCPHCPPTKRLAEDVANSRDDVEYVEMSTATREGSILAQKYGIMSVPTIIITGPGSKQPIGIAGLPPKKGLIKAINISLGKDKFKDDPKIKTGESFFKRIFSKKN